MIDFKHIINKMSSTKVKRASVAERFRKQMDFLTGDKKSVSELFLHPPLIPLPPLPPPPSVKLTKSQIMSLYDYDFLYIRPPECVFHLPR